MITTRLERSTNLNYKQNYGIMSTIILSNGSHFAGEEVDTIDELLEVLKTETIEERFFEKYRTNRYDQAPKFKNQCPISKRDGITQFFGNFERVSHVFRIETDDNKIIKKLSTAIKQNDGWIKYYKINLVNENGSKINCA